MRCGIAPKSAAAPATVSGEPEPQGHWVKPGKAVTGQDPRARRPTVDSVARRAGCLGDGPVIALECDHGTRVEGAMPAGRHG
jgi:hypothetical protein